MPQSISQVWLHIIFSTKERYPFLRQREDREKMHAYLAGACREFQCPTRIVGGAADHVHLLSLLSNTESISELLKGIKHSSSKWVKSQGGLLVKFKWQRGYAAFGVSVSKLEAVHRYIQDQERHHQRITFQEELRKFLDQHGVEYDERHLWD